MADLELVEQLRQRAHVTYDEAKEALDACGDDLLDAVIYLERKGKVPPPSGGGTYTSEDSRQEEKARYTVYTSGKKSNAESFSDMMRRFFAWFKDIIQKGCVNMFEVRKSGEVIISLPVLVLVLLILFAFWVTIPLMIVGLFFSFRYTFRGPGETSNINNIMEEVANVTENLKNEMRGPGGQNND